MKLKSNLHRTGSVLLATLFMSLPAFTVLAVDVDTSSQARQLIDQMSRAGRQLNYDGIFVYRHGNNMETMRLIHKADGDKEQERLVSLTGPAREVVRDNASVTCIFPDNHAVMVEKSRPKKFLSSQLPEPIESIAGYYSFSVAGKDRVAGRSTWIVNIVPKDDFRYGYQLWIDEESMFMLKFELKDDSGWPVEQILFTNITFLPHIPAELLEPAITGTGYTWYNNWSTDTTTMAAGTNDWKVTRLPGGFKLSSSEKQEAAESSMSLDHMVYSDGLAMVSVFIEKVSMLKNTLAHPVKIGGVNAFATYTDGHQITAVGEVPLKTVRLMANSVMQTR